MQRDLAVTEANGWSACRSCPHAGHHHLGRGRASASTPTCRCRRSRRPPSTCRTSTSLPVRPRHHAGDPRRLRPQPPRDDPGLSRHRQIDAHRAGRGPAQLAVRARQSRQPHQPHRPDRQGRDRPARRQAGDRVPRGHAALVAAAAGGAGVRRVRCRPAGRDVRDPARARGAGPHDAARPEPGDPAAPAFRLFATANTVGPRRHLGPLPRHAADQPGPDGPLEHRRPAQLPGARRRVRDRARQVPGATTRPRAARRSRAWSGWPT